MYQSKVKLSLTFTQRLGYLIKLVTVKWSNEHSEANEGRKTLFKWPKPVRSHY